MYLISVNKMIRGRKTSGISQGNGIQTKKKIYQNIVTQKIMGAPHLRTLPRSPYFNSKIRPSEERAPGPRDIRGHTGKNYNTRWIKLIKNSIDRCILNII